MGVQTVYLGDHGLGIGEPRLVEPVGAPLGVFPVAPVHDDVVERQLALAVLLDHAYDLLGGLVALAALPESIGPARHHHRGAGQVAIARDHLVQIIPAHEIVVDRLADLGGQVQRVTVGPGHWIVVQQADIAAVRVPFDADLVLLARRQGGAEVVVPGVPVLPPAVDDQLAIDKDLGVVAGIELEGVSAGLVGLDLAFPDDLLVPHRRLGRRIDGFCRPARQVLQEAIVDVLLDPADLQLAADIVAGREAARLAAGVKDLQVARGYVIGDRIAEPGDGVVVPQQAVTLAGQQHRHRDDAVILQQLHVLAVVVHLAVLVLAQAVEGLVRARIELLANLVEVLTLDLHRDEGAAVALAEHQLAGGVAEVDRAILQRDRGRGLGGLEHHAVGRRRDRETHRRRPGRHHQAGRDREAFGGRRRDADDAVAHDLQPHAFGGARGGSDDHAVGGLLETHLQRQGGG